MPRRTLRRGIPFPCVGLLPYPLPKSGHGPDTAPTGRNPRLAPMGRKPPFVGLYLLLKVMLQCFIQGTDGVA